MQLATAKDQSAGTMDQLRALNARFIHNFVTNDVASHDAILHPRFINIWPTGQRWGPCDLPEILGDRLRSETHPVLGCPR